MSPAFYRALKVTLKSLAGLLAILLIALLLLLWRLSSSPIQLNQFVPRVEQVASKLPGGLSVRLKGLGLFWDRAEREIDLRALSVELVESSGTSLVSVPEVNISLSGFALLRGVFALSAIELHDVDVQLVRRADGSFQIFRKTDAGPVLGSDKQPRDFTETVQHLFKVLAAEEDTNAPLTYLKSLKIKGSLEIEDRKNDLRWAANAVESLFVGHKGEVNGSLGVTFSSPRALSGIHTDITLNLKDDALAASLEFAGVRPAGFAPADQRLAALAGFETSLSGVIKTSLTLPDKVHSLSADIKGTDGRLSYRDFYPEPLKLNSLDLQLSIDLPAKSLQVSSLDLSLGEAATQLQLHLQGAVQMVEDAITFNLGAGLQQLKVNDFDLYWPKGVALGARNWLVQNLKAGTVSAATLNLAMLKPNSPEKGVTLKELNGSVNYVDLTVAYFGSLPPATGVTGAGTFDRHGFDLAVSSGQVNGVSIESGKVVINGLDNKKAAISVSTDLQGPFAAVMAVLEAPPIKLGVRPGTTPISAKLEGQLMSDFSIALPLKSGLDDGDINYRANGRVTSVAFRKAYKDYDLQTPGIDFNLDQSKAHVNGPMEFSGIPFTIDWTTSLAGSDRGQAEFTIDAPNVTGAQISTLGFDVTRNMQGSIALHSTARLAPGGLVTASLESDLSNSVLSIPQIHWIKAKGDEGKIDFNLQIEKNHFHASDINIVLGKVKTGGNAEFDLAGPVMSLTLEQLSLSYAQLKGIKLSRDEGQNLQFTVQGGEASLEPFLLQNNRAIDPQEKKVAVGSEAIIKQLDTKGINFNIGESKLDKVYVNKDTFFDNVRFSGRKDSKGWQEASISAHNPSGGSTVDSSVPSAASGRLASDQFHLVFGPSENGRYPLRVEVEDLGYLVSAFKGENIMKGGYLVLNGESQGPFLTQPIQSTFEVDSFTLKQAPAISRLLNMASLTQIISTLMRTGLAFNSASGDLQLDGARVSSKKIRMRGGSLAVLGGGWVDLKQKRMEIGGTIVPFHKLNAIVGKVPLLGDVVTGKDGNGIMAVNYTAKGAFSQPEFSIDNTPLTKNVLEETLGEDKRDTDPDHR